MPALISDYFTATKTAGTTRPVATTLSAQKLVSATTATVQATTGWETGTAVHGIMYRVDANNNKVAGSQIDFKAVVSGTSLNNFTVTAGTDDTYAIGAVVELAPTAAWADDVVTGLLVAHDQDGTLKAGAVDVTAVVADSILTKAKLDTNMNTELNTGWVSSVLPAVSSVTYNGNRSYDITFASTVASTLSSGMRLRTTRTSSAPTQCTSLNGTTQYWSKSSPTGMAQTDSITEMAWIKLTSYSQAGIISRNNGSTDGWLFYVNASGQLLLGGARAADDFVISYQSVPLNKWVHVAASINTTTTTGVIYFDGVAVPSSYTNNANTGFAAPTQTYLIGANNGNSPTQFFPGKIAQAASFSAVISAATIKTYVSQGLTGSESSLISAYSFNGVATDLTANANNLTANGSAVATNADSPFGNAGTSSTLDYALVQSVSTTVATVQVPEGCTIPTSGGVTSVAYSVQGNPLGFVPLGTRWSISVYDSTIATNLVNSGVTKPIDGILYVNSGTAAGAFSLSQTGIVKTITGITASCSALALNGSDSRTVTFPLTFTSTPVATVSSANQTVDSRVLSYCGSVSTTTLVVGYQGLANVANATAQGAFTVTGV